MVVFLPHKIFLHYFKKNSKGSESEFSLYVKRTKEIDLPSSSSRRKKFSFFRD